MPLVAATLWAAPRAASRATARSFALAGLLAGLATLTRNDGVLLAGTIGLIWLADRFRAWRARRGTRVLEPRRAIGRRSRVVAGVAALGAVPARHRPVVGRQLAVFGSISPTSVERRGALDPRHPRVELDHRRTRRSRRFLAQGWGPIIGQPARRPPRRARQLRRADRAASCSCRSCSSGRSARARSRDFRPWFVYTFVVFAGATFLYPLHVPGGAFIHTAIGLLPHAAILSMEGVLARSSAGWPAGGGGGSRAPPGRSSSGASRRSSSRPRSIFDAAGARRLGRDAAAADGAGRRTSSGSA